MSNATTRYIERMIRDSHIPCALQIRTCLIKYTLKICKCLEIECVINLNITKSSV